MGTLNENYVYINLKKRQDFPPEIAFETPAFATYKGGEIDFVVQCLKNDLRYLVEVKAGKGTAVTATKALQSGKRISCCTSRETQKAELIRTLRRCQFIC